MYSTKEKINHSRDLANPEAAEADLQLLLTSCHLSDADINRFPRDQKRYADEILYKLLDCCSRKEIVTNRRDFFKKLKDKKAAEKEAADRAAAEAEEKEIAAKEAAEAEEKEAADRAAAESIPNVSQQDIDEAKKRAEEAEEARKEAEEAKQEAESRAEEAEEAQEEAESRAEEAEEKATALEEEKKS